MHANPRDGEDTEVMETPGDFHHRPHKPILTRQEAQSTPIYSPVAHRGYLREDTGLRIKKNQESVEGCKTGSWERV